MEIGIGIPGENGIIYPKYSEEKKSNKQTNYHQEYFTQKSYHEEMKER